MPGPERRLAAILPTVARFAGGLGLWLLAFIHLVLPFTPANPHPETHIRIGAAVIGLLFLALAILALRTPRRAAGAGLLFFLAVSSVAAFTERSPLEEGLPVKIFLVVVLTLGLRSSAPTHHPPATTEHGGR